jgi:hypothetical protein
MGQKPKAYVFLVWTAPQNVHCWPVVCLYIITGKLSKITDTKYYCLKFCLLLFEPDRAVHTKKTYAFGFCPISVFSLKLL